MNYVASQEEVVLIYHMSNLVLAVNSDALCLSESKARRRVGGQFFVAADSEFPHNNGDVHTVAQIIMTGMSLATEA